MAKSKFGKWVQLNLFGIDEEEIIESSKVKDPDVLIPKKKKSKRITIKKSVEIAVERLPKVFHAYQNPHGKSLVGEVKLVSGRPFVSDVTIMGALHELNRDNGWQYVKNIDHKKGIYEKL